MPLLRGEVVNYDGDQYSVQNLEVQVAGVGDVPVVIAALGPAMLKLAGEFSNGTNTWMIVPKTMELHIAARLNTAAFHLYLQRESTRHVRYSPNLW